MAGDEFNQAWQTYKAAAARFYEVAQGSLDGDRELSAGEIEYADETLGEVAECAERLTNIGEALLERTEGADRERITTLLLATAAVDIAIACEALQLGPERPAPASMFLSVAEVEVEPARKLIGEIDNEFFGMAAGAGGVQGGAGDPSRMELLGECHEACDELIDSAREPAWRFATGVASAAPVGFVLAAGVNPLAQLEVLRHAVGRVKRHLVKLIAEGFKKLIKVSPAPLRHLVYEAEGFFGETAQEGLHAIVQAAFLEILGRIAGRGLAEQAMVAAIGVDGPLPADAGANIRYDLDRLNGNYDDQMRWTGRIAKSISHAAPLISTLAAAVGGPLLIVALDGIGVGFVVCTLRMELTGHLPLLDGEGAATIVEGHLLPS